MSQNRTRRSGASAPHARGLWLTAALLAVVVVIAAVWVLRRGATGDAAENGPPAPGAAATASSATRLPSATASAPTSAASSSNVAGAWPDTGCNGSTAAPVAPQSVMTDVQWKPFLAAAIPVSATLGPTRIDGPLRTCFQHSPAGALLAAVNIELSTATPGQGSRVVNAQFTPGPGRDKALADVAKSTGSVANIAAFRLVGCTAEACNVEVIFFGGGRYVDGLLPVVWKNGDWYRDGAHTVGEPGLVAGIPAGFTAWAPVA